MKPNLSRRDFLKLGALSLGSLAFSPWPNLDEEFPSSEMIRIATTSVSVYAQPDDKSKIICQRLRDEVVNVYSEVNSPAGPAYNPLWYRVWRGYIHSAHTQKVYYRLNPVLHSFPEKGLLAEVTVPFTQSMRYNRYDGWNPLYRLYNGSLHWIVDLDAGPNETPWYRLRDELGGAEYLVQAEHMRPIYMDELTPISPDVAPEKKRIEVSIMMQSLKAYEDDKLVKTVTVSTGLPSLARERGQIPTETPTGAFHIFSKMPSKHMGDGKLTADIEAYELPGVPWVSFFEAKYGVAFHGTYWHTNFGQAMSHGCVNMPTAEARWLYRWCTPYGSTLDKERTGYGTLVTIT
jgi:lipoprotein-anchoring transpeptidase ErfK/SrfK